MKQKLITVILTLIVILVPLLIMPEIYYENYNILKLIILLVLGFCLLILLFLNYKTLKIDGKDILSLTFLILVILSTFFSTDIKKSILGETNRYEGLLMFAIYICIYISSKKYYKYKRISNFFNIIFYVSIVIGVLGILQRHINYINLYPIFNKGICSTFGNSNFFGSYISIVLPASLAIFIIYGNKKSFVLSIIMFFNMISSGTRSAWVAFAMVGLIGFIYLFYKMDKKYFKRALIILIIFILIFIYLFKGGNILKFNENDDKISITEIKLRQIKNDMKELKNSGFANKIGSNRLEIWKMTLKLIEQKPILGCGTDNLKFGLYENCNDELYKFIERTYTIVDKAHNEYLHIASTLGVPALIIYLIFIGVILFPKTKLIFKNEFYFITVLTIISYLVQAFFNISTIGVAPLFWMLLGLSDNNEFIYEKERRE